MPNKSTIEWEIEESILERSVIIREDLKMGVKIERKRPYFIEDDGKEILEKPGRSIIGITLFRGQSKIYCTVQDMIQFMNLLDEIKSEALKYHRNLLAEEGLKDKNEKEKITA